MKRRPQPKPALKQATPDDLVAGLLDFLQRKFYEGYAVNFSKDRRRLLEWVILWPAKWLDERGVTISPARYRELFMSVFMDGLRFGNTRNICYLPAYLAKIIQSHFDHHGDEIYTEAKSIRTLAEQSISNLSRLAPASPDPVREMATAARFLKPKRKQVNRVHTKAQLDLL
jgi:hypothetical protein